MQMFHQVPPTGGYPIGLPDLLALAKPGNFEQDFRDFIGVPYARATCSGTAALYVTLEAIKTLTPKRTVVIPSFTCPLVGLATVRAGFANAVCDMQLNRLDYNLVKLDELCAANSDIAVIVVTHLGGMAADIDGIKAIADRYNILLIEDAAQALGVEHRGQKIGTFGDFAFFSFARGKGMTLYEGGMLVSRHGEHAALLDATYEQLVPNDWVSEILTIAGLFGYAVFYRPLLFWFIFDLPYQFWMRRGDAIRAASEYNRLDFPLFRISRFRRWLGHVFFQRVPTQIARQRASAETYFRDLANKGNFQILRALPDTTPTYPYVTILFPDKTKRDAMMHALRAEGLGAFIIYIRALPDYDYMKPHLPAVSYAGGAMLADCTMTLSTSLFLTPEERASITAIFMGRP